MLNIFARETYLKLGSHLAFALCRPCLLHHESALELKETPHALRLL